MHTCEVNNIKFKFSVRNEAGRMSQSKKEMKGGGQDLDVHYGSKWASVTRYPDDTPKATVQRLFDRLKESGDYHKGLEAHVGAICEILK